MAKEDVAEQAAPKKLVLSLIKKSNETKLRMQSIAGELGQEVKDAVETKNLHAGALKLVAKLARMDSEKRDDFLRAYHLYWKYAMEAKLFEFHVSDLVDEAEAADGPGEPLDGAAALGDVAADNVRTLKRGLKKLPPEETSSVSPSSSDADAEGSYAFNN